MSSFSSKCLCLHLLILLAFTETALSGWIVKTLPGFSGDLPFTLETGQGHSGVDSLILYLNGGPGCSGLNGLFYQSGPLEFNLSYPGHGIPELIHCPHSWTKTANIIFIDAPVGAGFTYATNAAAYASSDSEETAHLLTFMRKTLLHLITVGLPSNSRRRLVKMFNITGKSPEFRRKFTGVLRMLMEVAGMFRTFTGR